MKSNSIFQQIEYAFVFVSILVTGQGCNSPDSSDIQPGHYEGSLIQRTTDGLSETSVSAEIAHPAQSSWTIDITNSSGTTLDQDSIEAKKSNLLVLNIPTLSLNNVSVSSSEDCFVSSDHISAKLCEDSTNLLIEIRDSKGTVYSLSLHAFSTAKPTPIEAPASYSLDDAMKHAFTTSFESRAEFERTMQASHVASNAWWNLLPRLNINLGVSAAKSVTGGFLELLGAIGDLAPFLLPTRWNQAIDASHQSDAEKVGILIMRGDTGAQVESLICAWEKDGDILSQYDRILSEAQRLVDQIRALEVYGQYPLGTADTIETTVDAMKMDHTALSATWESERAALAQALGFINPNAVTAVTVGLVPVHNDFDHLDENTLEDQVMGRSLELSQMDQLIVVAQNSKIASYFQWLDPYGDPNTSLGAAFPSAIEISQDRVDQLRTQRAQLEAITRQKARQALDGYRTAQAQAVLATQDRDLQEAREERVLELVKYSKDTNLVELVSVYQDLLRSLINYRTAQASVQIAQVKLNRLLLEGFYSQLNFVGRTKL